MTERTGKKSKHLKVFENCFAHLLETLVAQKATAEYGGSGRKSADLPRPNQPGRLERIVVTKRHENVAGAWLRVLNHFPSSDPASLDQVSHWKPDPPASMLGEKQNSWRQSVAQTQCRLSALNLNSHLTSLRKRKEPKKKTRKTKRAGEKGRCKGVQVCRTSGKLRVRTSVGT